MTDTTVEWKTRNNRAIMLGEKLGEGGEGSVWSVVGHPEVAKIYLPQIADHDREQKLTYMVAHPPQDEMRVRYNHVSITWPVDLVYQGTRFAGYLMPRLSESFKILDVYNPKVRRLKCPGFNWKYLVHTALNLAISVNALHDSHYVIGDINEGNILVNSRALVSLIDTDSFQVEDPTGQIFRCPVGKEEFTPPELQGKKFNEVNRLPQHDYFGLAALIFLLLMEGNYPFSGKMKVENPTPDPDNIYCLKKGTFPYASNSVCGPRPIAPRFEILPPEIRQLMLRCFVEGFNHPTVRPSATEWIQTLEKTEASLRNCRKDPSHWYSRHLRQCPWCAKEKPRLQVPLPPVERAPVSTPKNNPTPASAAQAASIPTNQAKIVSPNKRLFSKSLLPAFIPHFPTRQAPSASGPAPRSSTGKTRATNNVHKRIQLWFQPSSFRPRITRQFWWRNIKSAVFWGAVSGLSLAALVALIFTKPDQAGIAISTIFSLLIAALGGWLAFLWASQQPRLKNLTGWILRILFFTATVTLSVVAWQTDRLSVVSFLNQYRPQLGWLVLDGLLLGVGLGTAFGTFRMFIRYRNLFLAFLFAGFFAALPFIILFYVGAFSYSFAI